MQSDNPTTPNAHDSQITPDQARDILDLAARLSVTDAKGFSVAELQQVAQEAGISAEYLEQAIAQYTQTQNLKRSNQVHNAARDSQIIRSSPSSKAVRSPKLPRSGRKTSFSTQQKTNPIERLKSLNSINPQHLGKTIGVFGLVVAVGAGVLVGVQLPDDQHASQSSEPAVTKPEPRQPSASSSSSVQPCQRFECALAASLPSQQQMNDLLFFMVRGTLLSALALMMFAYLMATSSGQR